MRVFHDNFVVTIDLFIKPVSASVQLVHDTVQSGKNWKVKVLKTKLCPLYYYIFSMLQTKEVSWEYISLPYEKETLLNFTEALGPLGRTTSVTLLKSSQAQTLT